MDIENCHPTMFVRVIIEAYASDNNDEAASSAAFPTIYRYVESYKEWRMFAQSYYDVGLQKAKKILSRLFYGGRCPRGDPILPPAPSGSKEVGDFAYESQILSTHRSLLQKQEASPIRPPIRDTHPRGGEVDKLDNVAVKTRPDILLP